MMQYSLNIKANYYKTFKGLQLLIICFFIQSVFSQDPNFSNFVNNKIYYNPAYAGSEYGLRIKMAYRRQWFNMPDQFQTYYVSATQSVRCFPGAGGFGFMAISNTEGAGALQRITIGVPLSVRLFGQGNSFFMFGIMPGLLYTSINWDQLIFSGQLNPYYGNVNPSTFIPPDNGSSSKVSADISNWGILYRYESRLSQSNSLKYYRKVEIGFSAFHFIPIKDQMVNQSLTNGYAPLYPKYVIMANYARALSLNYDGYLLLEPSMLFEMQGQLFNGINMYCIVAGISTYLTNYNIDAGVWYRSKNLSLKSTDAIIAMLGYNYILNDKKNIVLAASLSYDFTISQLMDTTRGSPEISLTITFNKSSLCSDRPDPCDEGAQWMNRKKLSVKSYH